MNASLALARAVADAVLYEGYLLYPYRASAQKNQARWQFGILGPAGAADAGSGEEPSMSADCLLVPGAQAGLEIHFRFLQLQTRTAEKADDGGRFTPVDSLTVRGANWLSWDEAVEQDIAFGPFSVAQLLAGRVLPVEVPAGLDVEVLRDDGGRPAGRLVRRRRALRGELRLKAAEDSGRLLRLSVTAANTAGLPPAGTRGDADRHGADRHGADRHGADRDGADRQGAIAVSFIGAHVLLSVRDGDFVSLLDPPTWAWQAAGRCSQHRCWPVLAGPEGQTDVLLISPIILYDHPAVAPESSVALFDSTEIDEILTLRVLTLTDEEKAEARATDPRAAAVIDRCEAMSPEDLQQLHGALRNPHVFAGPADTWTTAEPGTAAEAWTTGQDVPWWNPEAEASVRPDEDAVVINGVAVARGSRVRVHPKRRADAQDLFFGGQTGRVTSVHFDVDGSTHVGLVLEQDPAADLHEGYGRSFYYAPDELEPLEEKENPQ